MFLPLTAQSLAQIVKTETACHHREAEDFLLPLLQDISSVSDYAAILQMFYGFHAPLEETLPQYISSALLPDMERRKRARLVLQDLQALCIKETPAVSPLFPQLTSAAQAFGVLYVLEGSALGGKQIATMLARNKVASIPDNALNFFRGYKQETGTMWATFLDALNKEQDQEAVVRSACETFSLFKNHMQRTLPHATTH